MKFSRESANVDDAYLTELNFRISMITIEKSKRNVGYIGKFDFIIWTIIPFIGITFCMIHMEQERLWTWTGSTPKMVQTFEAKAIISLISTIIGGSVTATLLKTVKTTSFTLIKYRGAHFSQLATMFTGFSISNLPILFTGNGWISITVIVLLLAISTITKQLAVMSMAVVPNFVPTINSHYVRNYTTCLPTNYTSDFSRHFPLFSLEALNSIRNQNSSYTNEYYDRSIPEGLKGASVFLRVLPFANASCKIVPSRSTYNTQVPYMESIQSTIDPVYPSAWSAMMTMVLDNRMSEPEARKWVNCTVFIGYANAQTTCFDTLCKTNRVSEIIPYEDTNYGLTSFMRQLFEKIASTSSSINLLQAWLAGGNITEYYPLGQGIPGETMGTIEKRTAILATIIGRIICDRNGGKPYDAITEFQSYYVYNEYYIYRILWKWPFWLIISLTFLSWLICMFTMWITPESRIMSVEWLLNQYITRGQWGYISGCDLVQIHEGSFFQVVDQKANEEIGNIVILKTEYQKDAEYNWVNHKKQYQ